MSLSPLCHSSSLLHAGQPPPSPPDHLSVSWVARQRPGRGGGCRACVRLQQLAARRHGYGQRGAAPRANHGRRRDKEGRDRRTYARHPPPRPSLWRATQDTDSLSGGMGTDLVRYRQHSRHTASHALVHDIYFTRRVSAGARGARLPSLHSPRQPPPNPANAALPPGAGQQGARARHTRSRAEAEPASQPWHGFLSRHRTILVSKPPTPGYSSAPAHLRPARVYISASASHDPSLDPTACISENPLNYPSLSAPRHAAHAASPSFLTASSRVPSSHHSTAPSSRSPSCLQEHRPRHLHRQLPPGEDARGSVTYTDGRHASAAPSPTSRQITAQPAHASSRLPGKSVCGERLVARAGPT